MDESGKFSDINTFFFFQSDQPWERGYKIKPKISHDIIDS